MKRWLLSLTAMGILATLAAAQPPPTEKEELDRLKGAWQCVGYTVKGKKIDEAEAAKMAIVYTFEGDRLLLMTKSEPKGTSKVKLNPGKSPREIDMEELDGPTKGAKLRGIYALEGDTLKLCLRDKYNGRPGKFEVPEGSEDIYLLFRRVTIYRRSLVTRMLGYTVSPVVRAAVAEEVKK